MDGPTVTVGFSPQPGPQTLFVLCPADIVAYGGARGGGKTYASLGEFWIHAETYGALAKGLMLRKTREDLKDTISVAERMYGTAATYSEKGAVFRFKSGAKLYMAFLERESDAEHYQGWSLTRVYIEEATQFSTQAPIMRLLATLRSAHGIRCQMRLTTNPGGPGHLWVKSWLIDNGPFNVVRDSETKLSRVFIPARISDNPALLESDPRYIDRLKAVGSAQLVKAWLEGDWAIIEGAFFEEWSTEKHVIQPFPIPADWTRFRSMDWGSAKPFSVGWWAVVQDDYPAGGGKILPRGALVRYREWYGWTGTPNVGLKMPAEEVAKGIVSRETDAHGRREDISYGILDPSAFSVISGPSIAETLQRHGVAFRRADNSRRSVMKKMGGWDQVRARLIGDADGRPMLYVFKTCLQLIRTLPVLQHDERDPEDVDTEQEDHAPDEARYACMSRPFRARHEPLVQKNVWLVQNAMLGILEE